MNRMLKIVLGLVLLVITFFIYWVYDFLPQGHGSHSNYEFDVSKDIVKRRIDSLLFYDKDVIGIKMVTPPDDNYYNIDPYFTVIIDSIQYCFRYKGDSTDWVNPNVELFIASIANKGYRKDLTKVDYLEHVETKFVKKLGLKYRKEEE
jgi:hypothetical protein